MGNGPKVLVIDVGGTNVKLLATGQTEPRKFPSGPKMTPEGMVREAKKTARDWNYDVVSIGYARRGSPCGGCSPTRSVAGPLAEPSALGPSTLIRR